MSGEFTDLLAVVACGAVVTGAEAVTIPLLRRAAIIDVPGHRSSHTVPTPRGGGIPIAAGLLVAAGLIGGANAVIFAFAVGAFGLLGFAEDLRGLTAGRRLIMQAAGGTMVAGLLVSDLAGSAYVLLVLVALVAMWITGFVNVFNFMDGVNGISGAHALIAGVVFAGLGWWRHDGFLLPAGAAVAVSALVFLPWNVGQARVFLGDAGSYALGAALAILAAYAVLHGIPVEAALGPLVLYRRHRMDAAAAHPGWRALAAGAPYSCLPAVVRCRMVTPAGDGDGRGHHGPAQPARGGQPGR
jgi:UDP-GlcNAc:undecaprenyl-phosphate GlcNAc-1-phosphate transferase